MNQNVEIGSREWFQVCEALSSAIVQPDAKSRFDGLSGGFRFDDEFPNLDPIADESLYWMVLGVVRELWAYRLSLVDGSPRRALADVWKCAERDAPTWAGFATDRRSDKMQPTAQDMHRKSEELVAGLEELDRKYREERGLPAYQPESPHIN